MVKEAPTAGTRDRIVNATHELFRVQGYNRTSLSQVVAKSEATTGSVYHFFPRGKAELAGAVLRSSGAAYGELVELVFAAAGDPAVAISDTFASAALVIVESDYIDPCPISTVAAEVANTDEVLRLVGAEVMQGWIDSISGFFVEAGADAPRAKTLATLVVSTIEGAFMIARATRDVEPFLATGELLSAMISQELATLDHAPQAE